MSLIEHLFFISTSLAVGGWLVQQVALPPLPAVSPLGALVREFFVLPHLVKLVGLVGAVLLAPVAAVTAALRYYARRPRRPRPPHVAPEGNDPGVAVQTLSWRVNALQEENEQLHERAARLERTVRSLQAELSRTQWDAQRVRAELTALRAENARLRAEINAQAKKPARKGTKGTEKKS
jgi:cell division protein FtsB